MMTATQVFTVQENSCAADPVRFPMFPAGYYKMTILDALGITRHVHCAVDRESCLLGLRMAGYTIQE